MNPSPASTTCVNVGSHPRGRWARALRRSADGRRSPANEGAEGARSGDAIRAQPMSTLKATERPRRRGIEASVDPPACEPVATEAELEDRDVPAHAPAGEVALSEERLPEPPELAAGRVTHAACRTDPASPLQAQHGAAGERPGDPVHRAAVETLCAQADLERRDLGARRRRGRPRRAAGELPWRRGRSRCSGARMSVLRRRRARSSLTQRDAEPSRCAYIVAVGGRAAGSFSSARKSAHETAADVGGSGGSSSRCAVATPKRLRSANGGVPARHSKATQPSAYTSLAAVACSTANELGREVVERPEHLAWPGQHRVRGALRQTEVGQRGRAVLPQHDVRRLDVRWTMPPRWRASSPAAISATSRTVSSSRSGPPASRAASEPPATYSSTR